MKPELEQAKIKHILFKSKLRAALYGGAADEEPLVHEDKCQLGRWISDVAKVQWAHWPEVRQLDHVHRQIHQQARELLALYHAGHTEQALSGMSRIDDIADELLRLLDAIDKRF